jgi:hypothetical protein
MQLVDEKRLAKVIQVRDQKGMVRAWQLLYEWVKTKQINFETFLEATQKLTPS